MTHNGIFATSSEILTKAGANYNTGVTEAKINELCLQVESYINAFTKYNWSDAFAGLNADVKGILAEIESDLVAIYIINYQMSGYTTGGEAETMLDVLTNRSTVALTLLQDVKTRDFMTGA